MHPNRLLFLFLIFFTVTGISAQDLPKESPVLLGKAKPISVEPLAGKELVPPQTYSEFKNPKEYGTNRVVPGKGFPKTMDAAVQSEMGFIEPKQPLLNFGAFTTGKPPTDPTGAVGPNHYVMACNSAFAIYDKEGNELLPLSDLPTLGGHFLNEDMGDPIVMYDQYADRFLIMQYSSTPNSLLIAVSKGPDPVNDGWYTYRFETGTFPDYPKLYMWGDGYYVTTNKLTAAVSRENPLPKPDFQGEVVYVLERDQMLLGEEAQHMGFPLPGLEINRFYSPAGFLPMGEELPPPGNAPVLYFQDDAWFGVNEDHLKIWLINVNWEDPEASTIELSQRIGPSEGVTPFLTVFDGGSAMNLPQPESDIELDALQGAVMYPAYFRSFPTHNSAVFNFAVDVDPSLVENAGIRWYELRQDTFGAPWRVYQEGTYAPDNSDRWCGSISIDKNGNIGMGFTIMNDNEANLIFPSLMYTGRYANDPLGVMTLREEYIAEGDSPSFNENGRYGDYSHISIDPIDDETFWFIGEYFEAGLRVAKVGAFRLAPVFDNDIGIEDIVAPESGSLGESEEITVTIRNYGRMPQSNFELWFSVDGGEPFREIFEGTIGPTELANFTFSTTADLSEIGPYEITAETSLESDEAISNDRYEETVWNLVPDDVGITEIISPETAENLEFEEVIVTLENFGGEPQSNFPIGYTLDGGEMIIETFTGTIETGEEIAFSFSTTVDLTEPQMHEIFVTTLLEGDLDPENDSEEAVIANFNCVPVGSNCSLGDGIRDFYLEEIQNQNIYCTVGGYQDFIGGFATDLDRSKRVFKVGVGTGWSGNIFSLWIDFNDNAVFEPEELLIDSEVILSAGRISTFEFILPENAPLGEHLMRVRGMDPDHSGILNDPCYVVEYGTTHDYSVVITSSIEESVLEDGELTVIYLDDDLYEISFTTEYQDFLWLTVYDILGQKLVENRVDKGFGAYEYLLDMSHAAPGVYLVRVGTREEGRVERIIVH